MGKLKTMLRRDLEMIRSLNQSIGNLSSHIDRHNFDRTLQERIFQQRLAELKSWSRSEFGMCTD